MSDYLMKDTTLTALGDEIRVLADTTDTMSPNVMISTLNTENTNFQNNLSTQNDLIAQIQTALQGKAVNREYDTCSVEISVPNGQLFGYAAVCFDGGELKYETRLSNEGIDPVSISNVVCGSLLSVYHTVEVGSVNYLNLTLLHTQNGIGSIFINPSVAGTNAQISIGQSGGGSGAD